MKKTDAAEFVKEQARQIPKENRARVLEKHKETHVHKLLLELFRRIDPDATVEITHSNEEYGKDLVIIKKDKFNTQSVVGVVVKVGSVKGRSAGRVDEIISQAKQAFAHPAVLEGVVGAIDINEVWIIIVGQLSRHANKRIIAEVDGRNIRIFDIYEIVDMFTEYYPEVFLGQEVTSFLIRKITEMGRQDGRRDNSANILQAYVEPIVAAIDIPDFISEDDITLVVPKKRFALSRLRQLLRKRTGLILTGHPGVGKTTALKKLTMDIYQEAIKKADDSDTYDLPMLVRAGDILKYQDLDEMIDAHFGTAAPRVSVKYLFIDGLDEELPENRATIIDKAREYTASHGLCVVIASRKIDIVKNTPKYFSKYELLPFEMGQAITFIQRRIDDSRMIDSLRNALSRIQHQITFTPLSLELLVQIAVEYHEIPATVAELYDQYADTVLGKYDREKGIAVLFDYIIKKKYLADLAYKLYYKYDRLEITRKEYENHMQEYIRTYGLNDDVKFAKELERSGILYFNQDGKLVFSHRSFLDFFIAYYLYQNPSLIESGKRSEIYYHPIWQEVMLFYFGLRKELTKKDVEEILSYEGKSDVYEYADKILTGRLLQAAWHSPVSVKEFAIKKATEYINPLRDQLQKVIKDSTPLILLDWITLGISEYAYGSAVLKASVNNILDDAIKAGDRSGMYIALNLLWAIRTHLNEGDIGERVNSILELASSGDMDRIDETTALIILMAIEDKENQVHKAIRRRLKKISRNNREIIRRIAYRSK